MKVARAVPVLVLLCLSSAAEALPLYSIDAYFGNGPSAAYASPTSPALNALGLAAAGDDSNNAIIWDGHTAFAGLPGGVQILGIGQANGLNDLNQAVGQSGPGPGVGHATFYSNGTTTDLGTLGGSTSYATSISNSGFITGSAALAGDSANHAFLYKNGVMTDISSAGPNAVGVDVNESGQVAGNYGNRAFIYSGGVLKDLGTLGGDTVFAKAINDLGQVVGCATDKGNVMHAFLYTGGGMQDLGAGCANSINNAGQIVGGDPNLLGGGFYYANGQRVSLDSLLNPIVAPGCATSFICNQLSQLTIDAGVAINAQGQILAEAEGQSLFQVRLSVSAVPEPQTYALMLAGLAAITVVVRRRKA